MAETISVTIPHETVNDESVRILSWKVASGSLVENEQLICEVETSKAILEIHAPSAGVVQYRAAVGDEVPVGSIICEIVPEAPEIREPALVQTRAAARATPLATAALVVDLPPARFTPLALNVAAEYGIDPSTFPPGTLVRSDDILRKAGKLEPKVRAPASPTRQEKSAARDRSQTENAPVAGVLVDWVDLPRRKIVEGRILAGGQGASIQSSVTTTCRAPKLRARVDKLELPVGGLNALVIFEVARILRKYPLFNAVHDRGRIAQYREVNIGWAIDGGQGLVVPVIRQADQRALREIAGIMEQHIEAYVGNSLKPAHFLGGTFTVSDLSAEGVSVFQPLISQGQSAILGVGSDTTHESGEVLYLTLAFDHQVAEGRMAAQFVRDLSGRLAVHSAIAPTPPGEPHASEGEPFCVSCQRDKDTLRRLNAILVKSEVPPGSVCSICLTGF